MTVLRFLKNKSIRIDKNRIQKKFKRVWNSHNNFTNKKFESLKTKINIYENKSSLKIEIFLKIPKKDSFSEKNINEIEKYICLISKLPFLINSFLNLEDIFEDDIEIKSKEDEDENKKNNIGFHY